MESHSDNHERSPSGRVVRWAIVGVALAAAYMLWTDHQAHLYGVLPYLLLAACPLMHLFHRHGHRNHRPGSAEKPDGSEPPSGPDTTG